MWASRGVASLVVSGADAAVPGTSRTGQVLSAAAARITS